MKSDLFRRVVSLIITVMVVIIGIIKNTNVESVNVENNTLLAQVEVEEYTLEDKLNEFENNNADKFKFYTNMFGIDIVKLNELLFEDNKVDEMINSDNLDIFLIDYLLGLRKTNSKVFTINYNNGNDFSKDYIYSLLNYFSNVYSNVDFKTLASIAYIESGNLNAKYMMKCNNIFGGMSSSGLIKYENIEMGVLKYVRMMSISYYGKGLNTVSKIASKYNPGSTTWVYNVNSVMNKFDKYDSVISIEDVLSFV